MIITHLADTPLSNAPANIAACQSFAGDDAIAVVARKKGRNGIVFPDTDDQRYGTSRLDGDWLHHRLTTSDVIHLHNYAWNQTIFKLHPHLIEVVKSKPVLLQYHSDRRAQEDFEVTLSDPFFRGRKAVLCQYHTRQYPECEHLVANPLPLHLKPFSQNPIQEDTKRPLVVAAVSNVHITSGYDYKGLDQIKPTLDAVERRGLITTDVFTGVPYDECLTRKRWAHICLEELLHGSYHLNFLEGLAFGCAVVGNIDDTTFLALAAYAGDEAESMLRVSYAQATPAGLESVLAFLATHPELRQRYGALGRLWIHKFWTPRFHADKFKKIYEQL